MSILCKAHEAGHTFFGLGLDFLMTLANAEYMSLILEPTLSK